MAMANLEIMPDQVGDCEGKRKPVREGGHVNRVFNEIGPSVIPECYFVIIWHSTLDILPTNLNLNWGKNCEP